MLSVGRVHRYLFGCESVLSTEAAVVAVAYSRREHVEDAMEILDDGNVWRRQSVVTQVDGRANALTFLPPLNRQTTKMRVI